MDETIPLYLALPEHQLWSEYVHLRDKGLRGEALLKAAEVAQKLESYPQLRLEEMVFALCSRLFRRETGERVDKYVERCDRAAHSIPHPLFLKIILPQIRKGYEQKMQPYARWLAQLRRKIDSLRERSLSVLGLMDYDVWALLEEALVLDPNDNISREVLIFHYDSEFYYYIHEVPTGLLVGVDEFRTELSRFTELVSAVGEYSTYEKKIAKWRFYCETWADYLSRRAEFINYEDYLQTEFAI